MNEAWVMTAMSIPVMTATMLADMSRSDSSLSQIIDHASSQDVNWWLAGISIISLLVLGWVGRWLVKGYAELQAHSYVKDREHAEREEKASNMLRDVSQQLANVNRDSMTKLSEVTIKVTEVVTRNSDALDHNSEQSRELIRAIDKMERSLDGISVTAERAKNFMREQREFLQKESDPPKKGKSHVS